MKDGMSDSQAGEHPFPGHRQVRLWNRDGDAERADTDPLRE